MSKADRSQPATAADLARMAKCSRALLYTDKRSWGSWVLRRLGRIAAARSLGTRTKNTKASDEADATVVGVAIRNMKRENADLFHENLDLQRLLAAARKEVQLLKEESESDKHRIAMLLEELQQLRKK
jgi:hypothetical protein